jgi:hypothetical protein
MSATKTIATELEAWAAESVTGLSAYPQDPAELTLPLPTAACDIQRKRRSSVEPEFGEYEHEQRTLRLWTARLVIMVQPTPEWQQAQELYDIVDALEEELLRDRTLGNRVEASSPDVDVEFPGEVEHNSGVVALAAYFTITVGESAEVA